MAKTQTSVDETTGDNAPDATGATTGQAQGATGEQAAAPAPAAPAAPTPARAPRGPARASAEGDAQPKLVKRTVAPRRSLVVNGETHGPGVEVEVPESEVAALAAHGFLVAPDAAPPYVSEGPQITRG
jgi:hypothetical protein